MRRKREKKERTGESVVSVQIEKAKSTREPGSVDGTKNFYSGFQPCNLTLHNSHFSYEAYRIQAVCRASRWNLSLEQQ